MEPSRQPSGLGNPYGHPSAVVAEDEACKAGSSAAKKWLAVGGLGAGAFGLQIAAAGPASADPFGGGSLDLGSFSFSNDISFDVPAAGFDAGNFNDLNMDSISFSESSLPEMSIPDFVPPPVDLPPVEIPPVDVAPPPPLPVEVAPVDAAPPPPPPVEMAPVEVAPPPPVEVPVVDVAPPPPVEEPPALEISLAEPAFPIPPVDEAPPPPVEEPPALEISLAEPVVPIPPVDVAPVDVAPPPPVEVSEPAVESIEFGMADLSIPEFDPADGSLLVASTDLAGLDFSRSEPVVDEPGLAIGLAEPVVPIPDVDDAPVVPVEPADTSVAWGSADDLAGVVPVTTENSYDLFSPAPDAPASPATEVAVVEATQPSVTVGLTNSAGQSVPSPTVERINNPLGDGESATVRVGGADTANLTVTGSPATGDVTSVAGSVPVGDVRLGGSFTPGESADAFTGSVEVPTPFGGLSLRYTDRSPNVGVARDASVIDPGTQLGTSSGGSVRFGDLPPELQASIQNQYTSSVVDAFTDSANQDDLTVGGTIDLGGGTRLQPSVVIPVSGEGDVGGGLGFSTPVGQDGRVGANVGVSRSGETTVVVTGSFGGSPAPAVDPARIGAQLDSAVADFRDRQSEVLGSETTSGAPVVPGFGSQDLVPGVFPDALLDTSPVPGGNTELPDMSFAPGGDLFSGIDLGRTDLADGEVLIADSSLGGDVVSDVGILPAPGSATDLALGDQVAGFLNVADDSTDFTFGDSLFGDGAAFPDLSSDVLDGTTDRGVLLAYEGDDVTDLFSGQDSATLLSRQDSVLGGDGAQLLAQNTQTSQNAPATDSGLQTIQLVGSGRDGVTQGLVTRASTGDGEEEIIVTPAREPDGSVSALIPLGSAFDANQPAQTYRVPAGTPLVRVTGSSPGLPGAPAPVNGVPGFITPVEAPVVEAPVVEVTPNVPPPTSDRPVETSSEPAAPGIPPNLVRAPIYAGSGAVASYFLNRSINPNLTLGDYLPLGGRGFAQDLVLGGALPEIAGFDPLTTALLNGARGATISQGLNVGARRALNPALNSISDRRNPGGAPANIRSDFAVGLNRIEIPLLDPNRLTVSPNASLNTDPPLRIDVGNVPAGSVTPTPDPLTGRFLVSPTGGVDPTTRLGQEFVTTPSARTQPLPPEWSTGVLPSRQVSPAQRQLEATADRLGLGNQLPDRQAPLTVFDLTNAPPAVSTQAQRMTDLTVTGINFGVPLANLAVDEALQATGQGDNVALGTLARGVATGIGVGIPISIAEGRLVSGAFLHPTWQSILADTATRAVLSAAPAPVQEALGDACSDENPVLNAGKWAVCNLGQNPNQNPPTLPPAGSGGVVVTDVFSPGGGGAVAITTPGLEPATTSVTEPVDATGTSSVPSPTVDHAALLREMQSGQRDLLARGVQADTAAQVFNNLPGIAEQFGLSPREATLALGGTPSDEVGQAVVGQAIVGPRIVGPAIVGQGIVGEGRVGPCLQGMACWGNGEAGILYVGTGEPATAPVTGSSAVPSRARVPVQNSAPVTPVAPVTPRQTPVTRSAPPPPPPAPLARDGGNWLWNAATGAWNWYQQANEAARQRMADTPQETVRIQRNEWFWPTAYEVRFPDGRQGLYDAGTGDRISGSGPANVSPLTLTTTPQSGLRIGPFVMPAGPGGVPLRGAPAIPF